jgi:ABC-type transport system substrate-binding protein
VRGRETRAQHRETRAQRWLGLRGIVWLLATLPGLLAAEEPLFEQEPYDQITLDENNDNAVLKVKPLDFPDRRVPADPRADAKLIVRLLERPEQKYELRWYSIDKVELFEQLVLQKANELVAAGKLEEAYDYFQFLLEKDPSLPGLERSWQDYLFAEGGDSFRGGRHDRALAMLRELYAKAPKREGLDTALGATTDALVKHYLSLENYAAARQLLRQLAEQYPKHPTVATYVASLTQRAAEAMEKARETGRQEDWSEAHRWCRRAADVWPSLAGLRQMTEAVHKRYPRVVVGAGALSNAPDPAHQADWAARRTGRLLFRTLTEYAGPGVDGGHYECPVGELSLDMLEREMVFEIRPGTHWMPGETELTSYDLSRLLLEMADPGRPALQPEWAALLAGIAVADEHQLTASLSRSHVRPEALLTGVFALDPAGADRPELLANGPYRVDSQSDGEVIYHVRPGYFAATTTQPRELVEREFADGARAVRALVRGEVHVLDRVPAWRLDALRGHEDVTVSRYAAPTVHCLVPNLRKAPTSNRTFRRALVYGIYREAILERLTGGSPLAGCQVLSGPFLAGESAADPLGYASDPSVTPRPYDPRMAIALATAGLKEVAKAGGDEAPSPAKPPPLVLARPPGEIPRIACTEIRRHLKLIGLEVELKEIIDGVPDRIPADVDLMYAELALWEPVVDARRILGEGDIGGACNPYVGLELRRLDRADDWKSVHAHLRRIHRLAHDDVTVVPLWQLVDHFAYRNSLKGIGAKPVSLYQNVEQWQLGFEYPRDEP